MLDERSAAFFALGLARQRLRPVLLVCTSGTAGANYYPAIIEASESGVPLLVITADRPPEMRACASGQTIDQQKMFGGYPNFYHELAVPEAAEPLLRYLRQTVRARRGAHPPSVCRTRAPECALPRSAGAGGGRQRRNGREDRGLGGLFRFSCAPDCGRASGKNPRFWDGCPRHHSGRHGPAGGSISLCRGRRRGGAKAGLAGARRRTLAGPAPCGARSAPGHHLRRAPAQPGVRGAHATRKGALSWRLADQQGAARLAPGRSEAADRAGERPARQSDALHGRTQALPVSLDALAAGLPAAQGPNGYEQMWSDHERRARAVLDERLGAEILLFEPKAAWLLARHLPEATPIFIANSMPVRDAEYVWAARDGRLRPFCNRGGNGIDGNRFRPRWARRMVGVRRFCSPGIWRCCTTPTDFSCARNFAEA